MTSELVLAGAAIACRVPARPFYGILALMIAAVVVLTVMPVETRRVLDVSRIVPDAGYAYLVAAPDGGAGFGILHIPSDSDARPVRSALRLLENGLSLGPAHALHQTIRAEGAGSYSHWRGYLYFSASDNTDPRTNQRVYEISGTLVPSPWIYVAGLLAALLGVGRAACDHPGTRRWLRVAVLSLFKPMEVMAFPRWAGWVLLLGALAAGPLGVFAVWRDGITISLSLAGLLPLSDAGGYFWCANDLIYNGVTEAWCHRRPIYTVFLSTLTMIFDGDLHLTLLAQAALLLLAVGVYMREASRWLGMLLGLAAGALAVYLVAGYALTQVASEVLGLTLGLSSLAILLRAGALRSPKLALVGLLALSVALNARPGAIFALPAVMLWIGWMAWGRGHWRYLAMSFATVAAGFLVHALLVNLVGGAPGGSHVNFALVLYGLSVGGDWMTFYADYPGMFESSAYDMAIANIAANPAQFTQSLVRNLNHYFDHVLVMSIPARWHIIDTGWPIIDSAGVYVAALGVTAWRARRDLRAALVLAVCAGELVSAPLVSYDGGLRSLVVTAPMEALPVLVMIRSASVWLGQLLYRPTGTRRPAGGLPGTDWPRAALALIAIIALLWVPALTPLRLLARPAAQRAASCTSDLYAIVTRLDAGGPWLTLAGGTAPPALWPRRLSLHDFRHGIKPSTWFAESVLSLPPMSILVVRQQLESSYGKEHWLYYTGAAELPVGRTLLFCADPVQPLNIAERPFWKIVSFEVL